MIVPRDLAIISRELAIVCTIIYTVPSMTLLLIQWPCDRLMSMVSFQEKLSFEILRFRIVFVNIHRNVYLDVDAKGNITSSMTTMDNYIGYIGVF